MKKTTIIADAPYPDPPAHLSENSKTLWRTIGPDSAKSLQRRILLQAALEALDRCDQARILLAADGIISTTASTGAQHVHPAIKIERESKAQFLKAWETLGLNHEPDPLAGFIR